MGRSSDSVINRKLIPVRLDSPLDRTGLAVGAVGGLTRSRTAIHIRAQIIPNSALQRVRLTTHGVSVT